MTNVEDFKEAILNEADRIVEKNYLYLTTVSLVDILNDKEVELKYLIDGLIYEKTINLISGHSGVGKSLFTQILAGYLSVGEDFMQKFGIDTEYKIAFLDRENEAVIVKDRFLKIKCKPENIHYINLQSDFKDESVKEILQFIRLNKIDVIIVDTMVRYQMGDENSSKDINTFFRLLKTLVKDLRAIFVIHHLKKNKPDQKLSNESARGSTDITASCDCHFMIEKGKDPDFLIIHNVKNRLTKEMDDITFKISNENEKINLLFQGMTYDFTEQKIEKTKRLIIEAIETHIEADFDQIAKYVSDGGGYSQNRIRGLIDEYIKSDVIVQRKDVNRKLYSLNYGNETVQYQLNEAQNPSSSNISF